MTGKIIAVYLNGFLNKEEWPFPFWNIFPGSEILTFLYYANYDIDNVNMRFANKMVKLLNKDCLSDCKY